MTFSRPCCLLLLELRGVAAVVGLLYNERDVVCLFPETAGTRERDLRIARRERARETGREEGHEVKSLLWDTSVRAKQRW